MISPRKLRKSRDDDGVAGARGGMSMPPAQAFVAALMPGLAAAQLSRNIRQAIALIAIAVLVALLLIEWRLRSRALKR